PVLAAHLFVFYYGILADDTPPINLPAYATSGIAKADPIRTGIQGFKFDMGALLLPYAFILNPMLILQDTTATWMQIALSIATAFIGIIAWSTFIQNYLFTRYGWTERVLAVGAAFALLYDIWWTDVIGLALFGLIILLQLWKRGKDEGQGTGLHTARNM